MIYSLLQLMQAAYNKIHSRRQQQQMSERERSAREKRWAQIFSHSSQQQHRSNRLLQLA